MKANWERPALGNYRGELFTFGEVATSIAKLHLLYETIGLKTRQDGASASSQQTHTRL